jgi:hypothetical protein
LLKIFNFFKKDKGCISDCPFDTFKELVIADAIPKDWCLECGNESVDICAISALKNKNNFINFTLPIIYYSIGAGVLLFSLIFFILFCLITIGLCGIIIYLLIFKVSWGKKYGKMKEVENL